MMGNRETSTKAGLIVEIDAAWADLHSAVTRLSDAQLTTLLDSQGWSVKDHLTHITAWEASVVSFLQGRPRHEGLGVDQSLYSNASFDDINAVIRGNRKDLSLDEATAQLQATHRQLLTLLDPLTDADLMQPLLHFLPDSPGDDRRRAIEIVRDNTSGHFTEHLEWINALVRPEDEPE